jgi:hypothetical protein
MDMLEREMGYKEELFDFIQQYLRTILLKRTSTPFSVDPRWRFPSLPFSRSPSIPFIPLDPIIPLLGPPTNHPRPTIQRPP